MTSEQKPVAKRRLYLHIGMEKTGTTALQKVCSANRILLKARGVLYPDAMAQADQHLEFANLVLQRHGIPSSIAASAQKGQLISEIEAFDGSVLMSSEHLVWANTRQVQSIRNFFKDYSVQIIVTLRDQISYLSSLYTESLFWNRFQVPFTAFCYSRLQEIDYLLLIDRWSSVFGQKNVIVKTHSAEIVQEILDHCGLDLVELAGAIPVVHRSIPPIVARSILETPYGSVPLNELREACSNAVRSLDEWGITAQKHWRMPQALAYYIPRLEQTNDVIAEEFRKTTPLFKLSLFDIYTENLIYGFDERLPCSPLLMSLFKKSCQGP